MSDTPRTQRFVVRNRDRYLEPLLVAADTEWVCESGACDYAFLKDDIAWQETTTGRVYCSQGCALLGIDLEDGNH